jgi:hypothetical protein
MFINWYKDLSMEVFIQLQLQWFPNSVGYMKSNGRMTAKYEVGSETGNINLLSQRFSYDNWERPRNIFS